MEKFANFCKQCAKIWAWVMIGVLVCAFGPYLILGLIVLSVFLAPFGFLFGFRLKDIFDDDF